MEKRRRKTPLKYPKTPLMNRLERCFSGTQTQQIQWDRGQLKEEKLLPTPRYPCETVRRVVMFKLVPIGRLSVVRRAKLPFAEGDGLDR